MRLQNHASLCVHVQALHNLACLSGFEQDIRHTTKLAAVLLDKSWLYFLFMRASTGFVAMDMLRSLMNMLVI